MSTREKDKSPSRRAFLRSSTASALAFTYVPSRLLGADAPSNKLNIAGIGVGGMGKRNLQNCEEENIVALCDVDSERAAETFAKYPKAKQYKDFRVMLEKQKEIDAVIVATPDHTHAVITMAAMQLGKHVYCQKPLTHTVYEARKLTEAARYHKVQTQMGNQGHSSEGTRLVHEWLNDGAIGTVRDVHVWTDRPVGGDPWSTWPIRSKPVETPPVPESLDWDLWLGPVTYRPYHPEYHPATWRGWIDFGTGALGDIGCHTLDPAFWALDLGAPSTLQATSTHWQPEVASQTYPRASIVRYHFAARGERPPVNVTWYDGRLKPPVPKGLEPGRELRSGGYYFSGDEGEMIGARLVPESKMQAYRQPPKVLPRVVTTHEGDWIRACKDGVPACSNFEYSGPLTEMVLLGVIAIRLKDQVLSWDSENLRFTNSEEANALLHIDYREGWTL